VHGIRWHCSSAGLPQVLNNTWFFIFTALQICLSAPGESKYLNIKAGQINVHASTCSAYLCDHALKVKKKEG